MDFICDPASTHTQTKSSNLLFVCPLPGIPVGLYQLAQLRKRDAEGYADGIEYEWPPRPEQATAPDTSGQTESSLKAAAAAEQEEKEEMDEEDAPGMVRQKLSDGSSILLSECRGELFPPFISEESLRLVSQLVLPENSCFVSTYPKSGTTLTQRICQILLGREEEKLTDAVPWLLEALGPRSLTEHRVDPMKCRVFKTHTSWPNVKKQPRLRYIYVARNGR